MPLPFPLRSALLTLLAGRLPRQCLLPANAAAHGQRGLTQAAMRALCNAVPMGDLVLSRALGRYKLLVDAADNAHAPHLLLDGYWQWWVTAFLARTLRPGMRVVEVGGCYGYFSLLMADLVGPGGQLTVLEPNPAIAELLRRNLELNGFGGRAALQRAALAAAPGHHPFLPSPENPMAARRARDEDAEHRVLSVQPDTLSEWLAEAPPDLLKLDLAGELEGLWPGLLALAARHRHTALLLSFDAARCADPAALLTGMVQLFEMHRLDDGGRARPVSNLASLLHAPEVTLFLRPKG